MTIMQAVLILVFAFAFGCAVLLLWRRSQRKHLRERDGGHGFRPSIGFTRLDGMASLSVLLDNRGTENVWAEEIEVFLSDLRARDQTAEPSFRSIQKIRQMVLPGDMLTVSLSEVIYRAAGDPQRKYTCVLSSVVRHRIGTERFERKMENYRLQMLGLTVSSVHRERKPVAPFPEIEKSPGVAPQQTIVK